MRNRREAHELISVPEEFVYVYDMPARFNKDIVGLATIWHPEQYDIDQVQSRSPPYLSWYPYSIRPGCMHHSRGSGAACIMPSDFALNSARVAALGAVCTG